MLLEKKNSLSAVSCSVKEMFYQKYSKLCDTMYRMNHDLYQMNHDLKKPTTVLA